MPEREISHFRPSTRLSLLSRLLPELTELLDAVCSGYLLITPDEGLRSSYLRTCRQIEKLIDHPELAPLVLVWNRPFESLLDLEDADIAWEQMGRPALLRLRAKVEEFCLDFDIEDIHDVTVDGLLRELHSEIRAYKSQKKHEEARWIKRVEAAAKRSQAHNNAPSERSPIEKPPLGFRPPVKS